MAVTWTRVGAMVMERNRWIQDRFLEVMEANFHFPPAIGRRYFPTPLMMGSAG